MKGEPEATEVGAGVSGLGGPGATEAVRLSVDKVYQKQRQRALRIWFLAAKLRG